MESGLSDVAAGKRPTTVIVREEGSSSVDDPNVVILRHFEDPARRPSISSMPRTPTSPVATALAPNLDKLTMSSNPASRRSSAAGEGPLMDDAELVEHYRQSIAPYIFWDREPFRGQDLFEREAKTFPAVSRAVETMTIETPGSPMSGDWAEAATGQAS